MSTKASLIRKNVDRALELAYEIRSLVKDRKQPTKKQVKKLVYHVTIASENFISPLFDDQYPGNGDIMMERLVSVLGVLAEAGWMGQRISAYNAKYMSESLKEVADYL